MTKELDCGHVVYIQPLNGAVSLAIFLHKRWKWKIDKHTQGQRALAVDVITDLGRLSIVGVQSTARPLDCALNA